MYSSEKVSDTETTYDGDNLSITEHDKAAELPVKGEKDGQSYGTQSALQWCLFMNLNLHRLGKAGQRRVLKEADLCQHEEKPTRTNTVTCKHR